MRLLNYGFENFEMTSYEKAFANKSDNAKAIEITGVQIDPENFRYPLRRDRSEYLVLKSA